MNQNRSCNYYLESSFNGMINKSREKGTFLSFKYQEYEKEYNKFWIIFGSPWLWLHSSWIDWIMAKWIWLWLVQTWLFYCRKSQRVSGRRRCCHLYSRSDICWRNDISVYCSDMESVFVEIDKDQIGSSKNIIIGTIYRPPGHDIDNFNLEINKIRDKLHKENTIVYIMGDYNINLLNSDTHSPLRLFLDLMCSNMLVPLITRPTQVTANSATLIENIFTNNMCNSGTIIQGVVVTDITDHYPIFHINHELTTEIVDEFIVNMIYNTKNRKSLVKPSHALIGLKCTLPQVPRKYLICFTTNSWNFTISTFQRLE